MALNVIVEPHAGALSERISEVLAGARGRRPTLVVPTGDDVAANERELAGSAGSVGVLVASFEAMARTLGGELGVAPRRRLSDAERLALIRQAVADVRPSALRSTAASSGFAGAFDALVAELDRAGLEPETIESRLEGDGVARELAAIHRRYHALRDERDADDGPAALARVVFAARRAPEALAGRSFVLRGFDDLDPLQLELLHALAAQADVHVAIEFDGHPALDPRASLVAELGATAPREIVALDTGAPLLERLCHALFAPEAEAVGGPAPGDDSVVLLRSAGERGEIEAIAAEVARLLADGVPAEEILVVVRSVERRGARLRDGLRRLGLPVAVEGRLPLAATGVGHGLQALARCHESRDPSDLLAALRAHPTAGADGADRLEMALIRDRVKDLEEALEVAGALPASFELALGASDVRELADALAQAAGELAEAALEGRAPGSIAGPERDGLRAIELRAGGVARELLTELGRLERDGLPIGGTGGILVAIDEARVPMWHGPTDGRVRVTTPYRARSARARFVIVAGLGDREWPRAESTDPLLGERRREALGEALPARRDEASEERYLLHATLRGARERVYLSHRHVDDEGGELAPSPFLEEACALIAGVDGEEGLERAFAQLGRTRDLDRVIPHPHEATTCRELARALAPFAGRAEDRLETIPWADEADREAVARLIEGIVLPAEVLEPEGIALAELREELAGRDVFSATELEERVVCSYRWFVSRQLRPVVLRPDETGLHVGAIAHELLHRIYESPPGEGAVPTPRSLGRWQEQAEERLADAARECGLDPAQPAVRPITARALELVRNLLARDASLSETSTALPALLEVGFGIEGSEWPALDLGEGVSVRGKIDRIDIDPQTGDAVVSDYKSSATSLSPAKLTEARRLQAYLYVLAARRNLGAGHQVVGFAYRPLAGGEATKDSGFAVRDRIPYEWKEGEQASRLMPRQFISKSGIVPEERFEEIVEEGVEWAREAVRSIRRGELTRNPLNGTCPSYCDFQTICRKERRPQGARLERGEAE